MSADRYLTNALQNEKEFAWFLDILKRENVKSYLEIGSKWGGALWRVGNVLPPRSRIVSIDMPFGDRATEPHLQACVEALKQKGYDTHLILGDSTDVTVIDAVYLLSPFDCVFIDANHLLEYVKSDWNNYSAMGRIVAFHDINWKSHADRRSKAPIDVPQVWDSIKIKGDYRFEEIRLEPRDNGIGVLWRF